MLRERVASDIYVFRSELYLQVTAGVIVTEEGAVVVDTLPFPRESKALRDFAARRCPQGIRYVINTHAHADNVLANGALAPAGSAVPVLATATTAQTMAARCPDCLRSLTQAVGAEAMQDTQIVLPNASLQPGQSIQLTDRVWHIEEARNAHTLSDLLLWQPELKLLIVGGLVYRQRLPELAQGQLMNWTVALERLAGWRPQHVIGTQPGDAQDLANTRAYLCDLASAVWQAMERGLSPGEAHTIALPRYAAWAGYAQRQSFNAQRAWRELEPRWMAGEPPPCSMPDVGR